MLASSLLAFVGCPTQGNDQQNVLFLCVSFALTFKPSHLACWTWIFCELREQLEGSCGEFHQATAVVLVEPGWTVSAFGQALACNCPAVLAGHNENVIQWLSELTPKITLLTARQRVARGCELAVDQSYTQSTVWTARRLSRRACGAQPPHPKSVAARHGPSCQTLHINSKKGAVKAVAIRILSGNSGFPPCGWVHLLLCWHQLAARLPADGLHQSPSFAWQVSTRTHFRLTRDSGQGVPVCLAGVGTIQYPQFGNPLWPTRARADQELRRASARTVRTY